MKTKILLICSGLFISASSFIIGRYVERKKIKKHGTLNIIHYNEQNSEIMLFLDKKGVDGIDDISKETLVTFSVKNVYENNPNNHDA